MIITVIDPARKDSQPSDTFLLHSWGPGFHQALSPAVLRRCRRICELVATQQGLPPSLLFYRGRTERIAVARQLAMTLMREVLALPLMTIGGLFDRDHGTVIHAVKAIARRAETSPEFAGKYADLLSQARAF